MQCNEWKTQDDKKQNKINRKEIIFPERRMRAVSGTQRDGGMAEGTDKQKGCSLNRSK